MTVINHPGALSATQLSLSDLGTQLSDCVFVIVDLETTGGAGIDAGITEIGAVKVRGGEVIGEFTTLVNPGSSIPPFIATLTGITDSMVSGSPSVHTAVSMFLDFAGECVFVAHNAPYDIGFLKGACAKFDITWPSNKVIDTVRIARLALHRDEVRNCKLATLSSFFRTEVQPTHRAFDDARATTDVMHHLFERLGNYGVHTLEDLHAFTSRVSDVQRNKKNLADGLPGKPGVYIFEDPQGRPLYIGTSKNIRNRVRTYFTAAENRRRMSEMIKIAQQVRPIVCSTILEAKIRELRLIVSEQPRYNRRSRAADSVSWLKLTSEPAPRLIVTKQLKDDYAQGARYIGPFTSRAAANSALDTINETISLRTCTTKIAAQPRTDIPGCVRAELGKCVAPCTRDHDREQYLSIVNHASIAMSGNTATVVTHITELMKTLALQERFEEAANWREALGHYVNAVFRTERLRWIATTPEIVAAQNTIDGGWEIHVIRYGRLAAAGVVEPGFDPWPHVAALVASAEFVEPGIEPAPAGVTEEAFDLLRWLESDGVRLVASSSDLYMPINCGGKETLQLLDVRRVVGERLAAVTGHEPTGRPVGPRAPGVTRIAYF
ncbi:MAG: DEDD exonuclease domain-containing protein [Actinomycetales bacterium]|nr:DEDD exonuclease domain-containing protein [Actinomycetota bacterium]NCG02891.1 DEDD exonuclease domain-containing protein [Actinomycetales bacterium]